VAKTKKRIDTLEAWRCSHRVYVLKEWLGIPHDNARNALFHGANIEADLALFRYAVKHGKTSIQNLAAQAFREGYGVEPSIFSELFAHGPSFIIDAFNTRANMVTLDTWRTPGGRAAKERRGKSFAYSWTSC
jgi:hypothetical protein